MRASIGAILGIFLASAAGWYGWGVWSASLGACQAAQALAEEASNFLLEHDAAAQDPFVELLFDRRFGRSRPEFQLGLARAIVPSLGFPHATEAARDRFEALARAELADSLETHLSKLKPIAERSGLSCTTSFRAPAATPPFGDASITVPDPVALKSQVRSLHEESVRFLAEQAPTQARRLRADWSEDVRVVCRALRSLERLNEISAERDRACQAAAANYALGCKSGSDTSLRVELEELSKVRAINERKLRAKWGPRLSVLVKCD